MLNPDDTKILNEAGEAGFPAKFIDTHDSQHACALIVCGPSPASQTPHLTLARIIEAFDRFDEGVTVWLDVRGSDDIPAYVDRAIDAIANFGAAIIVSCNNRFSHGPGALLDEDFCTRVAKGNRQGLLWHPGAKETVYAQ